MKGKHNQSGTQQAVSTSSTGSAALWNSLGGTQELSLEESKVLDQVNGNLDPQGSGASKLNAALYVSTL